MDVMKQTLTFAKNICIVLLLAGCQEEVKPIDPGHIARRLAFREKLNEALGDNYHEPGPEANAEQFERGKTLYPQLCGPCHGGRGDGKGHTGAALAFPPPAFTDSVQADFFSEQGRLQIIRKGVPGTPMMAWGTVLPESDIVGLYLYIRSLIGKD